MLVRVTRVLAADSPGRFQRPAVGHPAQAAGQAFDLVGEGPGRVELGDAFDEGVAFDLDSPGGADRSSVGTGEQDARVVDVVGPRTDRAEVRQDIPDLVDASRDGASALNVGHLLTLRERLVGQVEYRLDRYTGAAGRESDRECHPVRQFRPRRSGRELTGAAASGDRVAHLVGAPQRHGDGSGEQVDQLPALPPDDGPCGSAVSVWAATDGRRRAPGIRRSASGRRAAQAPTPPPIRRPGSAIVATGGPKSPARARFRRRWWSRTPSPPARVARSTAR